MIKRKSFRADELWTITSCLAQLDLGPNYGVWNFTDWYLDGSTVEVSLRSTDDASLMTWEVSPGYVFHGVLVNEANPWDGLTPGDLVAGNECVLVYLGITSEGSDPYLMHVPNITRVRNSDVGFSRWGWYDKECGPLEPITEDDGKHVGVNSFRDVLGMSRLEES